MSKKYLTLEEAAEILGLSTTELNRLREKQQIRAFADRGSWKFKEEDVETLARTREADSSPDLPLSDATSSDDSSVLDDQEDILGNQPTVIRKGISDDSSDSDVRLIFDDSLKGEDASGSSVHDNSHDDVKLGVTIPKSQSDSDSDVKLAGASSAIFDTGSDSDVKLVTDELAIPETSGSDSDVRLVSSESSGEIHLTGNSDDSLPLSTDDSSVLSSESGISLGEGSSLALAGDSGISLESPADSGISLSDEGSILLDSDSGISLVGDSPMKADSGISLAPETGLKSGSGISLTPGGAVPKRSAGKKPGKTQGDDDLGGTIPLLEQTAVGDDDLLDTAMEVPNLSDSSESQDLFGSSSGDSTNVITLDDEEGSGGYDVTADVPVGGAAFDDEDEAVAIDDDEEPVDISDELIGEDDELDEDVFGAEDEDFASDDLESGESSAELPVARPVMVAPQEQEWGTGIHITLIFATILTVVVGIVTFDMVRNMWHTDMANHSPLSTIFVDMLKDM